MDFRSLGLFYNFERNSRATFHKPLPADSEDQAIELENQEAKEGRRKRGSRSRVEGVSRPAGGNCLYPAQGASSVLKRAPLVPLRFLHARSCLVASNCIEGSGPDQKVQMR